MHFVRFVFGMLFFLLPLQAAHVVSGTYDISFSIIGKIGEAHVYMDLNESRYHIHADGHLIGFAASMGKNRRESHDSYGHIVNGVYQPERYIIVREADGFYEKNEFLINTAKKTVVRHRIRERTTIKSSFDIRTMSVVEQPEFKRKTSTKTLPYFAQNDVLTLFFNVRHILKRMPEGSERVDYSVGTANKEGKVLIANPDAQERKAFKRIMPNHINRFLSVVIDQDIFESDRGELMLSLDNDYLAKEARLNDVLLFGDIHATMRKKVGAVPNFHISATR